LKQWTPPPRFAHAVKFGGLDVDVKKLSGALPRSERLALPGPAQFSFPLTLTFPQQGLSSFRDEKFRARRNHRDTQRHHSPVVVYRAAGARAVHHHDPVELGQKFRRRHAPCRLRSASDHNRIWTQGTQIEEQLANLNEHIREVTQMYLRTNTPTSAEYNEQAGRNRGEISLLVVADFPTNFSDVACKRLLQSRRADRAAAFTRNVAEVRRKSATTRK